MDQPALESYLAERIPILRTMGVRVEEVSREAASLSFPLAPNVNDKGTAFGGSLAAGAIVTGYGFVLAQLRSEGGLAKSELVVAREQSRFLRPVKGDFLTRARIDEKAKYGDLAGFLTGLKREGRGRIDLILEVFDSEGVLCFDARARFAGYSPKN